MTPNFRVPFGGLAAIFFATSLLTSAMAMAPAAPAHAQQGPVRVPGLEDRPRRGERAPRGTPVFEGTVESLDARTWTLRVRNGQRVREAQVTHQSRISLAGRPAQRSDLRPGQRVRVRFAMSPSGQVRRDVVAVDILSL